MTTGISITLESTKYICGFYHAGLQMAFDNKAMDISMTQKKMEVMSH
jgi:hypothetical protein